MTAVTNDFLRIFEIFPLGQIFSGLQLSLTMIYVSDGNFLAANTVRFESGEQVKVPNSGQFRAHLCGLRQYSSTKTE